MLSFFNYNFIVLIDMIGTYPVRQSFLFPAKIAFQINLNMLLSDSEH